MRRFIQRSCGFPEGDNTWLDREAEREVTSFGEIVRRAVREYIAKREGKDV